MKIFGKIGVEKWMEKWWKFMKINDNVVMMKMSVKNGNF